ncbi:MAG: MFS transporter [Ignavibacteriales bacterium]|nr:MFS transporter [Ignavibacteriales bacterium]
MKIDKKNNGESIKLFNRNYFLLWQGQFMSRIGSQVYLIAMIIWIKEATDSASLLGLMGFIGGIPAVLFSIVGGVFADRHSRKKIIVFTDVINGVLMLTLAFLFYTMPESPSIIITALMIIIFINSITGSYFIPAISASIPDIVHKDKLTSANSWSQGSQQIVSIFGLALGGLLYTLLGAPLLVLLNGMSFIFSAVSESFITIPQVIPEKKKRIQEQFETFIKDIKIGFGYIWERSGLKKLVLTSVLTNFFSVPIALLLPFYVDDVMNLDDSWLGYFLAISALGSLVGFLISGTLKLSPKARMRYIIFFIFLDGLFYILLGVFSIIVPVLLILFTSGFLAGFVQVHIQTILQITTESNMRGRIFGFIGTISGALIPIGMGVAGFIADLTNKNIPVIYIGSGIFILIISLYIVGSKDIRDFLAIDYSPTNVSKNIMTNNIAENV